MNILKKFVYRFFTLIIPFFLLIFNSSCSFKYYSPDDAKMMTLRDQHDAQLSVSSGLFNQVIDVQGAYSPIKHLRVSGSYFYRTANGGSGFDVNEVLRLNGHGRLWTGEIGGYYFHDFNSASDDKEGKSKRESHGLLFDGQLGLGKAKVFTNYSTGGNSITSFTKNFQQIGMNYIDEYFEFGFALRFGQLHYDKVDVFGLVNSQIKQSVESLNEINRFDILESTVRFSICLFDMKFYGHFTILQDHQDLGRLGTYTNNFGGGFLMEIDKLFTKKKKKKPKEDIKF